MKKACLSFLLLLFFSCSYAQIAQWIIPPLYDTIYFASGTNLIVTDSANTKSYFNQNGQRLFTTTETVNPFSDGYAVLTNDTSAILGFYDTKGNLTTFDNKKIKVANEFPYFTDGYLIVKRNRYYIVDEQGVIDKTKHLRVYPFHNGYAVCRDYENPQKKKGTVNYLMDKNKVEVPLVYKGKNYDASDVEFISSVNDEKIAVVIIKKSIYLFDLNNGQLSPLYFPNSESKHPTQAKIQDELPSSFDNSSNVIYARCEKNEQVTICFDRYLVLTDILYNNEKHHYTEVKKEPEKLSSPIQAIKANDLFGLKYKGDVVIPAQFDAVYCCFGDNAFAKHFGKQGMLQVIDNVTMNLNINNDNDVAFRHQLYETTIKIDMPSVINPTKIDLMVDPNSGCIVDKISKQTKVTDYGNRAEYSCRLSIPDAISEEPSEFDYPIQMTYDNIKLLPYPKKVKAWRDNYYDIVINDGEKVFDKKNGLISFPYTINTERFSSEETSRFELSLSPESLDGELQRESTTRGVCIIPVLTLEEGENYMFIELTEQGCPPISFPFTITYNKSKKQKQPTKADFKISKTTTLD